MFANQVVRLIQGVLNKRFPNCQVLGPTEAPIAKVKKMYRWQCLVKTESVREIQSLLKLLFDWERQQKSNVQMAVDVDPINLL